MKFLASVALCACLVGFASGQAPPVVAGIPWTAGMTCTLEVVDLERSETWYSEKLGFVRVSRDDQLGSATLRTPCAGVQIGLTVRAKPQLADGVVLCFGVFDLEAARAALIARGVQVGPIEDRGESTRRASFRDPDGHACEFQEQRPPATEAAGLAPAAFLAGSWVDAREGRRLEEHWAAPLGGLMVGVSRSVRDGKAVFFEHMRIETTPEGVDYVAAPGGGGETRFRLDREQCAARKVVFVNRDHDYPKRISYRLEADGALAARIDDGTDDGRHNDFRWTRGSLH